MSIFVVPGEGWRLDHVAQAVYGSERAGTTEALLAANPGLADLGAELPVGTSIALPAITRPTLVDVPVVQPWD